MQHISRTKFMDAVDFAASNGDDLDVREDYSGRSMYGATCLGVVCDLGTLLALVGHVGATMDDWDFVVAARSDGMGLSTIWYWPGVQLTDDTTGEGD